MLSLDPFSIAILHNSSLILLMLSLSIDKYRVCSHRNFMKNRNQSLKMRCRNIKTTSFQRKNVLAITQPTIYSRVILNLVIQRIYLRAL